MSGRRFLRLAQVKEQVGLSTATIYRLIAAKKFPASVPLGLNSVGWPESEIDDWSQARIAERDRRLSIAEFEADRSPKEPAAKAAHEPPPCRQDA